MIVFILVLTVSTLTQHIVEGCLRSCYEEKSPQREKSPDRIPIWTLEEKSPHREKSPDRIPVTPTPTPPPTRTTEKKTTEVPSNCPSTEKLHKLATKLLQEIATMNNDPDFVYDAMCDTVAVGCTKDEIIVTANIKERRSTSSTKKGEYLTFTKEDQTKVKGACFNFGISKEICDIIIRAVEESDIYKENRRSITVVEEKVNPRDNPQLETMLDKANDHASKHAEMKQLAYIETTLHAIGISKTACIYCHNNLTEQGVPVMPTEPGCKTVKRWRPVKKHEVTVVGKKVPRPQNKFNL